MSGQSSKPRLVVRTRTVPGVPVAAIRVWIRGGARCEEIPGQALVAGRLLAEGTAGRDWKRIAEEAEDRGISIGATAGYEVQSLALDGQALDWERALEWAAELALEPAFPEDRTDWAVEQARAELESLQDHPDERAEWEFRRQLYSPHPRCRPAQGSQEGLDRMTAAACRGFHAEALRRGVVVTVTGSIDAERARERAEDLFSGLTAGGNGEPARERSLPVAAEGLEDRREIALPEGEQAHLFQGRLTVKRDDDRLIPLEVLGVILGSGPGLVGRMPERLREAEGLAYECRVAVADGAGLDPGHSEIYLATTPSEIPRAERAIREELDRLLADGIEEFELEEARSYLLGSEPFRRETARQWASILAAAELYGMPTDRPEWLRGKLKEVDRKAVEEAARTFFDPSGLKVTTAQPSAD